METQGTAAAHFLGIDQGSSSSKALLLGSDGTIAWESEVPVDTSFPAAGEVEQSPEELADSVRTLIAGAQAFLMKQKGAVLSCIGLACQRSGVCAWDANSGTPLHPLISWRDSRFEAAIQGLDRKRIFSQCGIPPSPNYAGPKIAHLQQTFPQARVGTLDTFLLNALSDEAPFITEDTMAHRTMLYDLRRSQWDSELCRTFGANQERLAQVRPSLSRLAEIDGAPVGAALGDQQSALFYQYLRGKRVVLNIGSIGSVLAAAGTEFNPIENYINSVFFSEQKGERALHHYVVEGTTSSAGKTVAEIERLTGIAPKEMDSACQEAGDDPPVVFCPFGPTTTPDWSPDLPNLILAEHGPTPQMLCRALLENLGNFLLLDLFNFQPHGLMESTKDLPVTGGIARCDFLVQYLSNCLNLPIEREEQYQATALGAALAAAKSLHGEAAARKSASAVQSGGTKRFFPEDSGAIARYEQWLTLRERALKGSFTANELLGEGPL